MRSASIILHEDICWFQAWKIAGYLNDMFFDTYGIFANEVPGPIVEGHATIKIEINSIHLGESGGIAQGPPLDPDTVLQIGHLIHRLESQYLLNDQS